MSITNSRARTDGAARGAAVDLWARTVPADAGTVIGAVLIDVVLVLPFLLITVFGALLGVPWLAWIAAAATAIVVIVLVVDLARTGRTVGRRITGVRTVSRTTASPIGGRLFSPVRSVNVRSGRDPLAPAFAAYAFPPPPAVSRTAAAVRTPVLELDSGDRILLAGSVIIGRNPDPRPDVATVHRWTDMSRTLSKAHAVLEWDGQAVWVTDLGSTNGTAFPGSLTVLAPFARTRLPFDTLLRLGDRTLIARESA